MHREFPEDIILASGSPRRLEIMRTHGLNPTVRPSSIDETYPDFLSPAEVAMFLALTKTLDIKEKCSAADALITGADTIVVLDDSVLGKPADKSSALSMLLSMSGRKHLVITGVSLADSRSGLTRCFYETTEVFFRKLPSDEIAAYVSTDEPYDKAGGYAIQGTFAKYTEKIIGDLENVIGFPWSRFLKEKELLYEAASVR